MGSWGYMAAVFRKELKETLRDWKALVITYGMPLVVYPVLFIWLAEATAVRIEKERGEKYTVATLGESARELDLALGELKNFELKKLPDTDRAALESKAREWAATKSDSRDALHGTFRDLLVSSGVSVFVHVGAGEKPGTLRAQIFFDPTRGGSDRAAASLSQELADARRKVADERLKALKLSVDRIWPFEAEKQPLSGKIRAAVPIFGPGLLSLIMIVICLSAYYPALGATIAERENGTLHTLLSTPTRPRDLVLGKFLAVWLSSLLGLAAYGIPALVLYRLMQSKNTTGMTEVLPLHELPWLLLAVGGLSFLISASSIALGFLAKRQSEAQAMLSILVLSAMLPSLLVSSSDLELGYGAALVPLVNLSVLSKTLFVQNIGALKWLLTIAANVATGGLLLIFATHILENETRGETAFVRWKKTGTTWLREPTADLSFLYYACALAMGFYGSLALSGAGVWASLVIPQVLLFLLIPFFLARALGLSREETFLFRKPKLSELGVAALAAFPLAFAMGALATKIKIPQSMLDEFQKQLGIGAGQTTLALGITVAVLPAICEEFAFRGLILAGLLRRFSPQIAIVASSLMFAFMHVSLIRFVPTFIVGLVLGSIAFRTRSLWPGMLTHGLYNLTLVLLARS